MSLRRSDVVAAVEKYLRHLDARQARGNVFMLITALPLLFVAPLVFGSIYWAIDFFQLNPPHIRWHTALLIACIVTLPLLGLIAWMTRSGASEAMAEAMGDSLYFRLRGNRPLATVFLFDVMVLPYRLAAHACRRHLARSKIGRVDHHAAAEALALLLTHEDAMAPGQLLGHSVSGNNLAGILALLLHHDLIGIASEGDKVWISSDARERLKKAAGLA